jgi:RimJ/RimL family protein N-acetyltransferase
MGYKGITAQRSEFRSYDMPNTVFKQDSNKNDLPGCVTLRDVIKEDLPIFFEHQADPDACQMAAFPPRERDAFMAHWARIMANPDNDKQTILFDGQVAGNVVGFGMEGKREVGYWIGKSYWGKGIATQALAQFLQIVKIRPLFAHVVSHNIASRRVLEKCGFSYLRQEGEEIILKFDDFSVK